MDLFHRSDYRKYKRDVLERGRRDFTGVMVSCIWCHLLHDTCAVATRKEREASSTKWKFLCFSHSCSVTLQMAALPFVQPPGISPDHNGITSEKKAGKSDFIICHCGNICAERKRGHKALGFPAMFKKVLAKSLLRYLCWNINIPIHISFF